MAPVIGSCDMPNPYGTDGIASGKLADAADIKIILRIGALGHRATFGNIASAMRMDTDQLGKRLRRLVAQGFIEVNSVYDSAERACAITAEDKAYHYYSLRGKGEQAAVKGHF